MITRRNFLKGMASLVVAMNFPLAIPKNENTGYGRSPMVDYVTATEVTYRQNQMLKHIAMDLNEVLLTPNVKWFQTS